MFRKKRRESLLTAAMGVADGSRLPDSGVDDVVLDVGASRRRLFLVSLVVASVLGLVALGVVLVLMRLL